MVVATLLMMIAGRSGGAGQPGQPPATSRQPNGLISPQAAGPGQPALGVPVYHGIPAGHGAGACSVAINIGWEGPSYSV